MTAIDDYRSPFRVCLVGLAAFAAVSLSSGGAALAENTEEVATGILKIDSDPSGASIKIDGKPMGNTPALIELSPGDHNVVLEYPGHKKSSRTVSIQKNKILRAAVKLVALTTSSKKTPPNKPNEDEIKVHHVDENAEPGTITVVTTPPGLTVLMNDILVPQPTPVAFDVRPGTYELVIEDDGEVVHRKVVFVRPGRTLDLDLKIKKVRKIDYSDPWK